MRSASRSLVSCFRTPTYLSPRSQPPSTFPNRPPSRELFGAGQVESRALGGHTRTACLFGERTAAHDAPWQIRPDADRARRFEAMPWKAIAQACRWNLGITMRRGAWL